jgi:soluble lytic murein transglycosylase
MRHIFTVFLLIFTVTLSCTAYAATTDSQNYRRAFKLIDDGHADQAENYAHGRDAGLNKVIRAATMAQPGNRYSFNELTGFIANNANWPNVKPIQAAAELKIPQLTPTQILDFFAAHPPVTVTGFYQYIDALQAKGQGNTVADLVRTRWIDGDFSADDLAAFHARYANLIDAQSNAERLDRLLWKNDSTGARRLYEYIDTQTRATAETRLALANNTDNLWKEGAALGDEFNPGLAYEHLRWLRRNDRDEQAVDILLHPPAILGKPEAWWDERQVIIRRVMQQKNYPLAYRLTIGHGLTEIDRSFVQAEFLAGWLALRFLNRPAEAEPHFQKVIDGATTPGSRSRGLYWLARALEARGNTTDAEQMYEEAATLNATFYGQLAQARIYPNPSLHAMPEPTVPTLIRKNFFNREMVRIIESLHNIGEHDRAHLFFKTMLGSAKQRADFALLMELGYQLQRPDYAIEAFKAAGLKNMMLASGGFPLLAMSLPRPPEPAFTHALIRQESMFNVQATSPVGAQGLMQLMPSTAKMVARMCGLRYNGKGLCEPDYNIRLGTTYVQKQIDAFNGSYILALAGYNAGPARVRGWMEQIGDPRDASVDPIDWIESIPFTETRNYVQRIMESLQVYRARLAGGVAPLKIVEDLRR